jgi:mono/diheme cytochrome c family protein
MPTSEAPDACALPEYAPRLMTARALRTVMTTMALAAFGFGCSSGSSSSDAADAKKDMASDAPKDQASDSKVDAPAGDATDGPMLTPQQERGRYLIQNVVGCSDCHTPPLPNGMPDMTKYLGGNPNFVVLPNGDKLGTRNLTSDATGLKNRTDDEIKGMFLNGIRPPATGSTTPIALNPVMPYYVFHNMTGDDADAIVAFLRTVPPVVNTIPQRGASFDLPAPANYLDLNAIKSPKYADATTQESALHGKYLATQVGLCVECHTPHLMTGPDPLDVNSLFAGGVDFSDLFATTLMIHPVSKNLTSDNATGLGTWAAMDVINVLKMGKAKDGTGICPPMPLGAYANMTVQDATDIANYIKSLPPIVHQNVGMCVFPPLPPPDGGVGGATETTDGATDTDGAETSDAGTEANEASG